MHVCKSCGSILKKTGADMGYCPKCGSDSLEEKMLCPECGETLEGPTDVDMNSEGYHCSKCNIKVYRGKGEFPI